MGGLKGYRREKNAVKDGTGSDVFFSGMNPVSKPKHHWIQSLYLSLPLLTACGVDEPISSILQGEWELTSLNCDATPDTSVYDEGVLEFDGENATLSLTSSACTTILPFKAMFQTEARVRLGGAGEITCEPANCDADLCGTDFSENWGFSITYDDLTDPENPTLALDSLETDRGPSEVCTTEGLGSMGGYSFVRPD